MTACRARSYLSASPLREYDDLDDAMSWDAMEIGNGVGQGAVACILQPGARMQLIK